jgi:hypothetical protein
MGTEPQTSNLRPAQIIKSHQILTELGRSNLSNLQTEEDQPIFYDTLQANL